MERKYVITGIGIVTSVCLLLGGIALYRTMKVRKQESVIQKITEEYMDQNNYDQAIAEYKQAIEENRDSTKFYDAFIACGFQATEYYCNLQEYEKAYHIMQEVLDTTGDSRVERRCNWLKSIMDADTEQNGNLSNDVSEETTGEMMESMPRFTYSDRELSWYMTDYLKYSKSNFDVNQIDYRTILDYVYAYVWSEAADAIKNVGIDEWIPQYLVNNITEKTYGCDVPEQDFDDVTFTDNGFLYPALGLPGSWGIEYAIIDSVTEENGVYQITLLDTSYLGAEGKTQEELDAIYEYTADQIREDNDFEILGTVSCTLKDDGVNLLMQRLTYTPATANEEDTALSATDIVRQEIPELQDLFRKIYELSSQQAGVSLWEEDQQVYDSSGNMYDCTMVYVGESWPDRVQTIYIFAVDKNSGQVYWYDQENDSLTGIDRWREAAAYWFQ